MQVEFVNAYIERLVREVGELTKNRLLLETQLIIAEKSNLELTDKIARLEKTIEKHNMLEPVKKTAAKV
jgi:hypothetical protein